MVFPIGASNTMGLAKAATMLGTEAARFVNGAKGSAVELLRHIPDKFSHPKRERVAAEARAATKESVVSDIMKRGSGTKFSLASLFTFSSRSTSVSTSSENSSPRFTVDDTSPAANQSRAREFSNGPERVAKFLAKLPADATEADKARVTEVVNRVSEFVQKVAEKRANDSNGKKGILLQEGERIDSLADFLCSNSVGKTYPMDMVNAMLSQLETSATVPAVDDLAVALATKLCGQNSPEQNAALVATRLSELTFDALKGGGTTIATYFRSNADEIRQATAAAKQYGELHFSNAAKAASSALCTQIQTGDSDNNSLNPALFESFAMATFGASDASDLAAAAERVPLAYCRILAAAANGVHNGIKAYEDKEGVKIPDETKSMLFDRAINNMFALRVLSPTMVPIIVTAPNPATRQVLSSSASLLQSVASETLPTSPTLLPFEGTVKGLIPQKKAFTEMLIARGQAVS